MFDIELRDVGHVTERQVAVVTLMGALHRVRTKAQRDFRATKPVTMTLIDVNTGTNAIANVILAMMDDYMNITTDSVVIVSTNAAANIAAVAVVVIIIAFAIISANHGFYRCYSYPGWRPRYHSHHHCFHCYAWHHNIECVCN
jgi:hypothetical protein